MRSVLKIDTSKIFDKDSHVYENFVKTFMFFMFKIDLGLKLGYYMYSINLRKKFMNSRKKFMTDLL